MKVAIIGCGLIGKKRALALSEDDQLVACCDKDEDKARKFSEEFDCKYFTAYKKLLKDIECDVVIVAVVNKYTKDIVIDSLKIMKHVIAEKPLGRNLDEAKEIISVSSILSLSYSPILKTGFNHRFHPAILKAKELVQNNEIGEIINIRARYGHGGRPGMEKEWRASKELCGGGELLDQGVHIIDLIRWFGGDVVEVFGSVETKFWDIEVEDNAYAILKTSEKITATFHVSWTNWKNIFSFEIFGSNGYIYINGFGGSYGKETLELGKRKKEGGIPDIQMFDFPQNDVSWSNEWNEFKSTMSDDRKMNGSGYDGLKANEVIAAIYQSSKQKKVITID